MLAIDCGRLRAERLGDLTRLDHAIHRALMIGYVGLATGDRIGMAHFDTEPKGYLEPSAGLPRFETLRRVTSEIEYGMGETNFALAMLDLTARLRRRSLVVVFSEFVDSVTAQIMVDRIAVLARRHVVLFVASRDIDFDVQGRDPLRGAADLHRAVVRAQMRNDREIVLAKLRAIGVQVVDAAPDARRCRPPQPLPRHQAKGVDRMTPGTSNPSRPPTTLRSVAFRREREPSWRRLETVLQNVERNGWGGLTQAELIALPTPASRGAVRPQRDAVRLHRSQPARVSRVP